MGKQHLTEQDIIRAAAAIAATGVMPTIAEVRKCLGGRGSETTILNYLQKWKMGLLKYSNLSCGAEFDLKYFENLEQENLNLKKNLSTALNGITKINQEKQALSQRVLALQLKCEYLEELYAKNLILKEKFSIIKLQLRAMTKPE